ncbi:MAG: DUF6144 family protein [Clostridiaceae bacterium]|nr:DUF6144 family protein [Clostridiaceae bacterium]
MPQMTNVQGIRICNGIEEMFGQTDALEFAEALPLSKSADYLRKYKWAKEVCAYLEAKYTPEQIKILRMSCSCHVGDKEKTNTKRIYDEAGSLDEFCEKYNDVYSTLHPVWYEGEALFFSYPTCYCSCVKRVSGPVSPTWCLCTLGYAKELFDYVLGCDTEVELIESVKAGGSRCVIKIMKIQNNA